MSETYEVTLPNSVYLNVDKRTNKVYFSDDGDSDVGKYTKEYSKAVLQADKILRTSPYINYKPNYLDPNYYTGQKSHLSEFKAIQKLYYKDP
ncbi:hypothetical protein CQA53_11895, partial [Helicobacter didelphidarum]